MYLTFVNKRGEEENWFLPTVPGNRTANVIFHVAKLPSAARWGTIQQQRTDGVLRGHEASLVEEPLILETVKDAVHVAATDCQPTAGDTLLLVHLLEILQVNSQILLRQSLVSWMSWQRRSKGAQWAVHSHLVHLMRLWTGIETQESPWPNNYKEWTLSVQRNKQLFQKHIAVKTLTPMLPMLLSDSHQCNISW